MKHFNEIKFLNFVLKTTFRSYRFLAEVTLTGTWNFKETFKKAPYFVFLKTYSGFKIHSRWSIALESDLHSPLT